MDFLFFSNLALLIRSIRMIASQPTKKTAQPFPVAEESVGKICLQSLEFEKKKNP